MDLKSIKDTGHDNLLSDLRGLPQSFARDYIIRRAENFDYDDYRGELDTPKVELYKHLMQAGYKELAGRCREGHYDQGVEVGNAWAETEGREVFGDDLIDAMKRGDL